MGASSAVEGGHMPMPAAATQHEPVDMAAVAAKSARALAICKAATSAASDSSGAETAPNAGPTRLTLRQSSFASSDTGQQMTPELDTLARRSVSNAAAAAPASVATAVTVVPAPEVAASPAASSGVPIAGGGGTVRLTAAAVKLEPVSYGGGGGGVIVPTLKAESIPQLAPGGSGWMPQAAAARALSNRQSAARSKERRLAYVVGLEQSVKALSTQIGEQLTHLHSLACNHAALRTANQALHAHATELSDKLVAAEAEVVGLRAECKQLRQGTAAAAANAASPHSAEAALGGGRVTQPTTQHQPAQASRKHSRSGDPDAAVELTHAVREAVLPQMLPAQQYPQQPPQQQQQQPPPPPQPQQGMQPVVKMEPMDWEAFMDWGDHSNGSGGGGAAGGGGGVRDALAPPPPLQGLATEQQAAAQLDRPPAAPQPPPPPPQQQQPAAKPDAVPLANGTPAGQHYLSVRTDSLASEDTRGAPPCSAPPNTPPAAAPLFQRPSVSTGNEVWRSGRAPPPGRCTVFAAARQHAPPVQSGAERLAAAAVAAGQAAKAGAPVSGAAGSRATITQAAPGAGAADRLASSTTASAPPPQHQRQLQPPYWPPGYDAVTATAQAAAAAAAASLRLALPGQFACAGGGGGGGAGDGDGSDGAASPKRRRLQAADSGGLKTTPFPPIANPQPEPPRLMSLSEIDALVAKYTAAAPQHGVAGLTLGSRPMQEPQVGGGLRLCSAPSGLQICIAGQPTAPKPAAQKLSPVTSGGAGAGKSIMDEAASGQQMLQRPESAAALDEMAAIFDNFLADGGAFPELDAPDAL